MNEPKKTDFFPEIGENYSNLVAPNRYGTYQNTAEDLLHEERLREIEAIIKEKDGVAFEEELGELRYDEEADVQRWNELEQDFECVFDEAKNIHF